MDKSSSSNSNKAGISGPSQVFQPKTSIARRLLHGKKEEEHYRESEQGIK